MAQCNGGDAIVAASYKSQSLYVAKYGYIVCLILAISSDFIELLNKSMLEGYVKDLYRYNKSLGTYLAAVVLILRSIMVRGRVT